MENWLAWPKVKSDRARRVCRLVVRSDLKDPLSDVRSWGSGFRYGGGWIVTNSHVVGQDASNVPRMWVEFLEQHEGGVPVWRQMPPQHRVCFFVRLRGQHLQADVRDLDIAVFNMSEDDGKAVAMNDGNLAAVPLEERTHQLNFTSYCIHYGHINGGCPDQPQLSDGEQSEVLYINEANHMVLRRNRVSTVGGSSGSPVFNSENGELVGVHFSGTAETGYAVHFQIVRAFLRYLIPAIADVQRLNECIATYLQMDDGHLREEMLQRIRQLEQGLLVQLREFPWQVELRNVPPQPLP